MFPVPELPAGFLCFADSAGDIACSVGYEVCHEITDFVELSVTADRDDLGVISGEFLGLNASCVSERLVVSRCAKSGCFHDAGRYSDDADVVLAEFLCPAMMPGATATTRMLYLPSSFAQLRVKLSTAPLVAEYALCP